MARKTTFIRQDVIDAALTVLETDGMAAVTARRVADAMGASTAPVYSNFDNMEELIDAVIKGEGITMMLDYCRRPWTDDLFLSMGVGFIHFTLEHPNMVRAMYLDPGARCPGENVAVEHLLGDLQRHPLLKDLPRDHMEELLFQTSIYSLGLAATIVAGLWPDPDLKAIESWLKNVGGVLIRAALESAGIDAAEEMKQQYGEFVAPFRHPNCSLTEEDHD